MSALSSLLVQNQVLTVNQIEQVLQRQVIFGGDLAINLLELGLIEEDTLLEYMGRVVRQPVLHRADLDNTDPAAAARLPRSLAEEHRVIPVRFREDGLLLACASPPPGEAIEHLSAALRTDISFSLVLDFRLAMALERHYGLPMPARLAALQKRYAPDYDPDAEPAAPAADPVPAAPAEQLLIVESTSSRRRGGDSTIKFITRDRQEEITAPFGHRIAPPAPAPAPPPALPPEQSPPPAPARPRRLSFSEAVRELERAGSRDEIIGVLFDFARQAFEYTALFFVHGEKAQARLTAVRGGAAEDADDVTIPLDRAGMFATVHETRGFHLGPPGDGPADALLMERLGRGQPLNCAVIPISLRQRIILMLYGDSGAAGVRPNRVTRLADMGREVAAAFERILLVQKFGGYRRPSDVKGAKVVEAELPRRVPARDADLSLYQSGEPQLTPSLVPVGKARLRPFPAAAGIEPEKVLDAESWPAPSWNAPTPKAEDGSGSAADDIATRATEPVIETDPPVAPATTAAFDPGRSPARDLLSRVDAIEVSPDYRTTEEDDGLPAADSPSSPPSVLVQRVISVGDPPARPAVELAPEPEPEVAPEPAVEPAPEPEVAPEPAVELAPAPEPEVAPEPAVEPEPEPEIAPEPAVELAPEPEPAVGPVGRSVVIEMKEEIDQLIERVLTRGRFGMNGGIDEEAAELLLGIGDDALSRLVGHFPGPLFHDRYRDPNRIRPVTEYGPLLSLTARFGTAAVRHLLPLIESYDSEVRYFSAALLEVIPHPAALPSLGRLVFDNDRQIRALAVDVIGKLERFPDYRWTVQELAGSLTSPSSTLERKRMAANALGELQAPFTVKPLAEMLGSVDGVLAERCQRALVRTTFNDFGFSERRWLTWWQSNRSRHRIEWALDSVNHRKEEIRLHAIDQLKRMVKDAIRWPSGPLDHKQRKEIRKLVEEWWAREGRVLNPPPERG